MRKDMRDLITSGSRYKTIGKGRRNNPSKFDSLPDKERMRDRHGGWYREFHDRPEPLARYLLKQVGRKWDDVYADVCRYADSRSLRGYRLRRRVEHDRVVGSKWSYRRGRDVGQDKIIGCWHPQYDLYIDDNGILCRENRKEAEARYYKDWSRTYYPHDYVEPNPTIKNDDTSWYEQIDGIWYYMEKEAVKYFKYIHPNTGEKIFGYDTKIIKEQLNKKELKDLGIENENQS